MVTNVKYIWEKIITYSSGIFTRVCKDGDHPKFVKFLKDYYRFLESGQLVLSGTINYVLQETINKLY